MGANNPGIWRGVDMKEEYSSGENRLWYLDEDTPGPVGESATTRVRIGLKPANSAAQVGLVYSIGGSPLRRAAARPQGSPIVGIQYYEASIPDARPGDMIRYYASARLGNVWLPGGTERQRLNRRLRAGGDVPTFTLVRESQSPTHSERSDEGLTRRSTIASEDGPMNKAELVELYRTRNLSIPELGEHRAPLLGKVRSHVRERALKRARGSFSRAPRAAREVLERVELEDRPAGDWHEMLREALRSARLSARERVAAAEVLEKARGAFADPLDDEDTRVRDIYELRPLLELAEVHIVAESAGLEDDRAATAVQLAPRLAVMSEQFLADLVERGKLRAAEARRLGLHSSLFQILDGDPTLTKAVTDRLGPNSETVTDIRELAAMDASDWLGLLGEAEVLSQGSAEAHDYAASLARRLAHLYPTDAFIGRLPTSDEGTLAGQIRHLEPLLERHEAVVGSDFHALEVGRLDERSRQQVSAAHAALKGLANLYAGMRLAEVADDRSLTTEEKSERIARRIGLVQQVRQARSDLELLNLDYTPGSADLARLDLAALRMSSEEQRMVVSTLKSFQRIHAISRDPDVARRLLETGLSSGVGVATRSLDSLREIVSVPAPALPGLHERSQRILEIVSLGVLAANEIVQGDFEFLSVSNTGVDILGYLKQLDGFSDLFGSQVYCKCEHCSSILGPAAYFVDLMAFVDKHVRGTHFSGDRAEHALDLKTRRADLWTLELTCVNTNERIPTLEIVNEALENYIAVKNEYAGLLTDRPAVGNVVYQQTLSASTASVRQPLVLPLERLETYLTHFEESRASVARVLDAAPAVLVRAALGLSSTDYSLVTTTSNANLPFLTTLYRRTFTLDGAQEVQAFDAQSLLGPMGLTRVELAQLIRTKAVRGGGSVIFIRAEKLSDESVQNDVERIHELSLNRLDRMHRFLRLWRAMQRARQRQPDDDTRTVRESLWSIPELDLVLASFPGDALSEGSLQSLTAAHAAQARLRITVEELVAMWATVPMGGLDGGVSLFNRAFNPPAFAATDGPFPKPAHRFIHPGFHDPGNAISLDPAQPRLLAALGVGDEGLHRLIVHLADPLGLDLGTANEDDRGVALSIPNLTLLYRHAALARALGRSIDALFQLIALAPAVTDGHIASLEDLSALLDFDGWRDSAGLSLDDLGIITGGPVSDDSDQPDPAAVSDEIIGQIHETRALVFADTVFAIELGLTEAQSREIIAANPTRVEEAPGGDGLRLRHDHDPTAAITIPPHNPTTGPSALAILNRYCALNVMPMRLGATLNLPSDKTAALVELTNLPLSGTAMAEALWQEGPATPLEDLVRAVTPLSVLFRATAFDAEALAFIGMYPALYDRHITPDDYYPSYIQTYIERDVRNLKNIGDLNTFRRFLQLCAGRVGQILNYSSIAHDLGIDHKTVKSWISVLEASYIIFLLNPHHRNFNKRVIKQSKLYFYDTGLAASLLRIRSREALSSFYLRGNLFENFIIAEYCKSALHSGTQPDAFFFRDSTGNEVDLIIDKTPELIPIEIKSGETITPEFFKGLIKYQSLSKTSPEKCFLIYPGKKSGKRKHANVLSWIHLEKLKSVFP